MCITSLRYCRVGIAVPTTSTRLTFAFHDCYPSNANMFRIPTRLSISRLHFPYFNRFADVYVMCANRPVNRWMGDGLGCLPAIHRWSRTKQLHTFDARFI